ncbi:MAG: glycosyltransferase family 2 protein [Calothrix sp. MO_192.B10]|nr:glycosyltransferase family 2 protein [Calothrix sp. MO_192.B10]
MLPNIELEQPLVSIIIPTYNRCHYLQQAIDSAINQTYQNIEIIISDNCSIDDTQEIVESFLDSRIKYWQHPQNIGMFANQMHGFKMARGKYIASLHDDDIWEPDFLAKLVPTLEAHPNSILAFCDQYIIDGEGNIDNVATERYTKSYQRHLLLEGVYQPFSRIALIDKSIPTAAACLIRREFVNWDNIPPEVGGMWDLYLTYLCCTSSYGAYYVPEKLTRYREHLYTDTMLSGHRDAQAKIRKAKSEIFCYQRFMEDTKLKEFHRYFRKKWLEAHTTLAIGLLRIEQVKAARYYIWQAINQQKFNLRTLAALTLSYAPRLVAHHLLGTSKQV